MISGSGQITRHCHAQRGRKRSPGVSCFKFVVDTFITFEKTGEAFVLTNCVQLFAASGQHFMHVSLMTDIPNQFVFGRFKRVMQRDCQFDCAQTCARVTADFGKRFDHVFAGFGGDLRQLFGFEFAQVFRVVNFIE